MRLAKLCACVEVSNGVFTDQCLQAVVTDVPVASPSDTPRGNEMFLTKSEIAMTLFRGLPESGLEKSVDFPSLVRIYAGTASTLSVLGYERKKAFVLRELVALLLPAVIQSRKDSAARLGIHPAANLSSMELTHHSPSSGEVFDAFDDSIQGLRGILQVVANTYGILLTDRELDSHNERDSNAQGSESKLESKDAKLETVSRVEIFSVKRSFGNQRLKFDVLRLCLQMSEALPDARGIVEYIGALLLTAGKGVAAGAGIRDTAVLMPFDDQARMLAMLRRTVATSKTPDSASIEGSYWDEFLVSDIQVQGPAVSDLPTMRQKSDLKQELDAGAKGKGGPFIYNPFGAKPQVSDQVTTLLLGQRVTATILLQNLYDVDVEIEWIRLESQNSAFEAETKSVLLGPSRMQKVHLTGLPRTIGEHAITGCIAKVAGCSPRSFSLFKQPWHPQARKRLKRTGLAAADIARDDLAAELGNRTGGSPEPSNLEVNVIQNQPPVVVRGYSSYQSSLILLEGESAPLTVTLENTGEVEVNFFAISFLDSVVVAFQAAIAEKELHATQLYEEENAAHAKPAFRRKEPDDKELVIPAKGTLEVEIEVFGKKNLARGSLTIEYGHVDPGEGQDEGVFFTRHLNIPISVTVTPNIQLINNEFLPFSNDFSWFHAQDGPKNRKASGTPLQTPSGSESLRRFEDLFRRIGLSNQGEDHCVLLLDFQNAWSRPLSLSLQVRNSSPKDSASEEPWNRAYTVHETVQAGAVRRVLVLLPRLRVPDPHRAIPSLSPHHKRQFVVSGSQLAPAAERAQRELFWYREAALQLLRATWAEPGGGDGGGGRHGTVDLRRLRLPPPMLDVVRLEDVGIAMALRAAGPAAAGEDLRQVGRATFEARADADLVLTTRVANRLAHPVRPLLRLQPSLRHQPYNVALDLAKKVAVNGLLQRALPALDAGAETEVALGLTFLCAGDYEVDASVEEVKRWKAPAGEGRGGDARARANTGDFALSELESSERRVWHASEPCTINVLDAKEEWSEGGES